jgi:hypothetical protein
MRAGTAAALGVLSLASGAVLAACFDLFHSTADIRTACEIDSSAPGCPEAPTSLCSHSHTEALARAEHACAWLGACEAPLGRNAFGPCMFQALLAFDCEANPNHRVKGKGAALWACLANAKSCSAIDDCVFPSLPQACTFDGSSFRTVCGSAGDAAAGDFDVRILCAPAFPPYHGENCALWGQTCSTDEFGAARCSGGGEDGGCSTGCFEPKIHAFPSCPKPDGGDDGIDCASYGAQQCGGFPSPTSTHWVACIPETDADAAPAACTPGLSASCSGGVATSCPTGVLESIDCSRLLGVDGGCAEGTLSPSFDWTAPCSVTPSECLMDSCEGSTLTSCERGAAYSVDCKGQGLGTCSLTSIEPGAPMRAACAPPP